MGVPEEHLKPQKCVLEELLKPQRCVCALWGSNECFVMYFLCLIVSEGIALLYSRHSKAPKLTPLFGSLCGLFQYSSHDPTRTVHEFNNLDSRDVSPLYSFLPVFLFASLQCGEHMQACFHSMCFLFSSQQLREWRGGILLVCGVCSNGRNGHTGSLSSSCFTSYLLPSSPWVRGNLRSLPQLPSSLSGTPCLTVTAASLALLHEPAGCGWGPRTLRAPPHSFTQGTSWQCGPAYQQGCKSSCHQGEWMVLSLIISWCWWMVL